MCDELKQANKIIKKLHDSNQEQTQKVNKFIFIFNLIHTLKQT